MKKEELIKFCRYYKGEEQPPMDSSPAWEWERAWVDETLKSIGQGDKYNGPLSSSIDEYCNAGMSEFSITDDTPAALKAVLFNRFYHWNEGGDFKEWYTKEYLKGD